MARSKLVRRRVGTRIGRVGEVELDVATSPGGARGTQLARWHQVNLRQIALPDQLDPKAIIAPWFPIVLRPDPEEDVSEVASRRAAEVAVPGL